MSVYRPKGSPYYHYDFQLKRHRFHGSTQATNRREAERIEDRRRDEAKVELAAQDARAGAPMTVDTAVDRYWIEVGQFRATADEIWSMLEWLVDRLGPHKRLAEIRTADVAELVARRRSEGVVTRRKARMAKPAETAVRPISNARINRAVIEPLRRVLRRARDVWGEPLTMPEWKLVTLPEPQERVREASTAEETAIMAAIRDDYAPALAFALLTGCRRGEIVGLTWPRVMWEEGVIEVVGKGDRRRLIPITRDIRLLLWPLQGNHPVAVFTYVAQRADRKRGIARGDRLPITHQGLKTRWRRDRARTDIENFRFHDTRHTAATRLVRETGNLKLAQKLLGHTDIATTAKYAHAALDDIRDGMERVADSRKKSRTWMRRAK